MNAPAHSAVVRGNGWNGFQTPLAGGGAETWAINTVTLFALLRGAMRQLPAGLSEPALDRGHAERGRRLQGMSTRPSAPRIGTG